MMISIFWITQIPETFAKVEYAVQQIAMKTPLRRYLQDGFDILTKAGIISTSSWDRGRGKTEIAYYSDDFSGKVRCPYDGPFFCFVGTLVHVAFDPLTGPAGNAFQPV
jgi:hypothetical protein